MSETASGDGAGSGSRRLTEPSAIRGAPSAAGAEAAEIWRGTRAFVAWLDRHGPASYDPYDTWGTRYGLWARRVYYRRPRLGAPLVAPLLLLEIFAPGLRRLIVRPDRYPTADAQLLLGFLNLHRQDGEAGHLQKALRLGDDLLRTSIPGYSGHCWGYPFDWQNNKGLWKRQTPYITATPYAYEAFLGLEQATGEPAFGETARSIARFVAQDLRETPTGPASAAGSYSPHDSTRVINASAYRAFVLFDAAQRFQEPDYETRARRNLQFILECQRTDGSWWYGLDGPKEAFIDHFHTCFVLKNLIKVNRWLKKPSIGEAIQRGWTYYRRHLFGPDDAPRSFAVQPRTQLVLLEMYNMAEAITLGTLLEDTVAEALPLARKLALRLVRDHQLADGHFVTRVYFGGIRHALPFMRWPQSQLFLALTYLLGTLDKGTAGS